MDPLPNSGASTLPPRRIRLRRQLKALQSHIAALTPSSSASASSVPEHSLRLLLSVYTLTYIYETLLGLLRGGPRKWPAVLSITALRLASFIASFSFVYRVSLLRLKSTLSFYWPNRHWLAPGAAALVAAPTMLLETRGPRRAAIGVYAVTRAVQAGYDTLVLKEKVPEAMSEGRWWWGGHLLFA